LGVAIFKDYKKKFRKIHFKKLEEPVGALKTDQSKATD